jgi:hypothetical protein
MKIFLLILLCWSQSGFSQNDVRLDEVSLLKACSKHDLPACETLGAYYIKIENWEKANIVGVALCDKDRSIGCTYAGISLLAKGKASEGTNFLTKACDKFEPFACRSLGRLMKKNGEGNLSHLYFRRACHYGLKDVCSDLKKGKTIFSKEGLDFISKIQEDCADTQLSSCSDKLSSLSSCSKPLSKEDCQLIPGHLSIFFRAKLMQSEAKFSLLSVVASQKALKNDTKINTYSYDLSSVLKNYKPLANYHYVFGFMKACAPKEKTTSLELFPESHQSLDSRVSSNIRSFFLKGKTADCYNLTGGFEAFAVANLDPLNKNRLDVWKIDQDSNLIQVTDGLPRP